MAHTARANSRRGDFKNRPQSQSTATPLPPEEQKKTGIRATALRMLLNEAGGNVPALAMALGLGVHRVRAALEGDLPIGPETAAHIEYIAHLPGSWLDHPELPLPSKASERIQRAVNGEPLEDEEDEQPAQSAAIPLSAATPAPQVHIPAASEMPALSVPTDMTLRVVKQSPKVTVRKRRVSQAEQMAPLALPVAVVPEEPPAEAEVLAVQATPTEEPPVVSAAPEVATQDAPRRGRKPGVKTVSLSQEAVRRDWLRVTTQPKGAKSHLCRLLQAPDSFVAHLLSGRRTFTNNITEKLESVLGLEPGHIDRWSPEAAPDALPAPALAVAPEVLEQRQAVEAAAKAVAANKVNAKVSSPGTPVRIVTPVAAAAPAVTAAPAVVLDTPAAPPAKEEPLAPSALREDAPLNPLVKEFMVNLFNQAMAQNKIDAAAAQRIIAELLPLI